MSEVTETRYPEAVDAYEKREPIQFRWRKSDQWFDYDYTSKVPPGFDVPVLVWRKTPKSVEVAA